MSHEPNSDQLPLGMRPGINAAPLAPPMRDAASREEAARPLRTFVLSTVPVVVVLVGALLLTR